MNSNLEKTKYNVACNHILENKYLLSYLIKNSLNAYKGLDIDEIMERFLSKRELVDRGKSLKSYVKDNAELGWRKMSENDFTLYNLSQPGMLSILQLMIRVINEPLDEEEMARIYRLGFFSTMEKFGSNALLGNSIYDPDGNVVQLVAQFLICVNPPEGFDNIFISPEFHMTRTQVYPPTDEGPKEIPFPSPYMFFIIGLGNPDEEVKNKSLEVLDIVFTHDMSVDEKVDVLKNQYGILFNSEELLDLEIITNYKVEPPSEKEDETEPITFIFNNEDE